MFDRILKAGLGLVATSFLTGCPGKSGHSMVPKPGQAQLPQVYIFFERGEVPRGLASMENLAPQETLETEVNGRIEFVPLDEGPTAVDVPA